KGVMHTETYGNNPRVLPKEKHDEFGKPKRVLARSKHGVKGDFIVACKGGEPASASFEYSGPFTEFVLAGTLASRAGAGKKLGWAGPAWSGAGADVAHFIRRAYRRGWEV